jgi:[protein-PII] uridylyltransferase
MNNRTVMELVSGDRPGLLAATGKILRELNIFIQMAKIVTVGERAEDVFYITDHHQQTVSPELEANLRDALVSADADNS